MNNTTLKIVVAGPPHSGKSVFLGGLMTNLPRKESYLFRACPDGEGNWTYTSEEAAKFRRKGKFTADIVDWYCSSLQKMELTDIVMVDVGGIPSDENKRIIEEGGVKYGIILSGDPEKIKKWDTFLNSCGVEVIARIHSDYNGDHDVIDAPLMSVHHLERGEDVSGRPAIEAVAAIIMEMMDNKEGSNDESILEIADLAKKIGKKEVEKTLPNGRVIHTILWEGSDLPKISSILSNAGHGLNDHVKINGGAPGWLVTAITHMVHPASVSINSPDGYVPVGASVGDNTNVEVELKDNVLNIQAKDPSVPFKVEDLNSLPLPEIFGMKTLILSGRMPNWMLSSVADFYSHRVRSIACFQPGVGSTVAITHSDVQLGTLIK